MQSLKKTQRELKRFHRDKKGAVALVMLAAFLALFMMGLVIYDTTLSVSDKMDVQAAADSASWSQSTIEARTMNMVAFTNVSKRVTVGMTSMYAAAIEASKVVKGLLAGLSAFCWGLTICPGPCQTYLVPICRTLTRLTITAYDMHSEEKPDINKFDDLLTDFFGKDLQALDNYQTYMIDMTPWWSYAEGVLRGVQSGATSTASFPAPDTLSGGLFGSLTSMVDQSDFQDRLPVGRGEQGDTWEINRTGAMCSGVTSGTPDQLTWQTEFFIKTIPNLSNWREFAVIGLMELYMLARYDNKCDDLVGDYGDKAKPVEVHSGMSQSQWQMFTSNLTLAYYADKGRLSESGDRSKFGFVPTGIETKSMHNHEAPGYWAFSRSEISYRGDQSTNEWKWNPRWTTRMRPVALPGEWSGLSNESGTDIEMKHAWRDVAALLGATATALDMLGMSNGDFSAFGDGGYIWDDAPRLDAAAKGMNGENIEGAAK